MHVNELLLTSHQLNDVYMTILAGQVLTISEKLISSNSKFALGFFQPRAAKRRGQSLPLSSNEHGSKSREMAIF
ncbi:hypothetical protein GUJ93_ZPchr0012g21324 [Zizania palustris]|uniref:Uncharacterized protein n=1 Tax=Zizania palustris TaxID=103762 RepID=A0A8J5WN30_ZIZPA|nr:hypothetical protein GUJ93_ZPchr0012g21324 [Zizania palustris]